MKTYVLGIISKIQEYSYKLDDLTELQNHHWVLLNNIDEAKEVFIFRKNGELLISKRGRVEKVKWEYLGNNSMLIELQDQTFLFSHSFLDDNFLALKVDGDNEYVIFINETNFDKEIKSINEVESFLEKEYLVHPITGKNLLKNSRKDAVDIKQLESGFNFKMGKFKKYRITFANNDKYDVYHQVNSDKYYIYFNQRILLFQDFDSCKSYVRTQIL